MLTVGDRIPEARVWTTPQETAATVPVSGERSSEPFVIRASHASRNATSPPVIEAQRVPPSAWSTSQST